MKKQITARPPVDLANRRISILNDIIFHYVFAHEQGTQCLKILVNTVLENAGLPLAEDLHIRSPFNLAEYLQDKLSVIDVRARDSQGRWFNIEVQNAQQKDFLPRTLYYWANTYAGQLDKGDQYGELNPTIGIHLTSFPQVLPTNLVHESLELRMIHDLDVHITNHQRLEYLDFSHLSTTPPGDIVSNRLLSLMYFLYHEGNPEDPLMSEIRKQNPDLDEIDTRYKRALSDDDLWVAADRRRKAEMTYRAITDFAVEQGIEKGKKEGQQEELSRIVNGMHSRGIAIEIITELVGKSLQEIEDILGN